MWVASSSHTAQWPSGIIYVRTDDREFELLKTLLNFPVLSLCLRLSEETLRYVGSFHLLHIPLVVKYPTRGANV